LGDGAAERYVTDDAFERISAMIVGDLAAQDAGRRGLSRSAGAMVTQSHEDGEGELLRRVRAVIGPTCRCREPRSARQHAPIR